jgi:hypothetical protein
MIENLISSLRKILPLCVFVTLLHFTAIAQQIPHRVSTNLPIGLTSAPAAPSALVLAINGECEFSESGGHFIQASPRTILLQGATIRTGKQSRMDVFFRGIGTTIRLQENTEVKFEEMSRSISDDVSSMTTVLDLRKGRIFTVVRSLVAGSVFEIRNAAGRSVVAGEARGALGRYIITADGSQIAHSSSVLPLKVLDHHGITIITPGETFDPKEGKPLKINASDDVKFLIEFDELNALSDASNKD